jgi:hypothetical protein
MRCSSASCVVLAIGDTTTGSPVTRCTMTNSSSSLG